MAGLTRTKARKILRDKEIRGKPLTKKQIGFFGARAGGAPVKGSSHRSKQLSALKRKK